jgi:hypothetical protein
MRVFKIFLPLILLSLSFPSLSAQDDGSLSLPDEEASRKRVDSSIEENIAEAKKLKSEFVDEVGVDEEEYSSAISDHVVLLARVNPEMARALVQMSEYAYRKLNFLTYGKLDAKTFSIKGSNEKGRLHLYFVGKDAYEDLVVFMSGKYPRKLPKSGVRYILKIADKVGGNWLGNSFPPMSLAKMNALSSSVTNGMGFCWAIWNSKAAQAEINIKTRRPMGVGRDSQDLITWFQEGVGIWSALDTIGVNHTFRITQQKYSNLERARKGGDSDYVAIAYELASGIIKRTKGARKFYQLSRTGLNSLTSIDLAMSWSIIDYLIKGRIEDWRGLIKKMKTIPSFRIAFVRQFGTKAQLASLKKIVGKGGSKNQRSLDDLYRRVCDQFEKDWKAWAMKEYEAEYNDPTSSKRKAEFTPIEGTKNDEEGDGEDEPKKKKKKKKKRRRRH